MNILYVIDLLGDGGVERMTLHWVRRIADDEIKIDFLVRDVESKTNEKLLLEKGCQIYKMPYAYEQLLKRKRIFYSVMKEKQYDIIHVHGATGADFLIYKWAKKAGVDVRIAHSHNANCVFRRFYAGMIHKATKKLIPKYATTFLGCSMDACEFYYGDILNATIIANGIDTDTFRFRKEQRDAMRQKYQVEDMIVYGSAGRCENQKNQIFLMEIYSEILKQQPEARFLLVGHGSLEKLIEEKAKKLGLTEHLIWIKQTSDMNFYMAMMDVFVLPSLYEGLVVVGVEAQSMGLPVLISEEAYHKELSLTNLLNRMKLSCGAIEWAKKCITLSEGIVGKREDFYRLIDKAGYSIDASAEFLKNIYFSELKRIKG